MDMLDAGIFAEPSTDRVQRNDQLRIIVFDSGKIAKLPFYSVIGSEEIGHLNVYPPIRLGCDKVYLAGAKNADCNFKPLSP